MTRGRRTDHAGASGMVSRAVAVPAAVALAAAAAASLRLRWRAGRDTGWEVVGPPIAPTLVAVAALAVFALVMHYLPGHLPSAQDPAKPRWATAALVLAAIAAAVAATAGIATLATGGDLGPGPWVAVVAGAAALGVAAGTQGVSRH